MSNTPAPVQVTSRTLPALRIIAAIEGACFYRCNPTCTMHHEANKLRGVPYYQISSTCDNNPRYANAKAHLDSLNRALVVVEAQQ